MSASRNCKNSNFKKKKTLAKRNLIQEIKSIKSRAEYNSRYDLNFRLNDLEYALNEFTEYNGNYNKELLKYIPISTVSCFEAFFKSVVKELVDFGNPFNNNVSNFNQSKNIKFDFEIVSAIQTKSISVGELIAHFLSFNNFEDINSNISVLIGDDFLEKLKNINEESSFLLSEIVENDFKNRFPDIISSVKKTYELRHIFCHEFATNVTIDEELIINNFRDCKIFLEYTNNLIWEILYPNSPQTQTEMNQTADEDYKEKDKELNLLLKFIATNKDKIDEENHLDQILFDTSIKKWEEYRKSVAEYQANNFVGGSMYSLVYYTALKQVTIEKIESLKNEFEIFLRKNNYD